MKRLSRNPVKFDVLGLFAKLAQTEGFRLDSVEDQEAFSTLVRSSIGAAQRNERLLHGKRVEVLFGHVAAALGACRLIKVEDAGEIFVSGPPVLTPDYRLVLDGKRQMLVEVKSCYGKSWMDGFVLKRDYLAMLERYAELQGLPLLIAVYFPRFNCWSLLSKDAFQARGDNLEITVTAALAKSRMCELGDLMVGTLPELRLELTADPKEECVIGDSGEVVATFCGAKLFCCNVEVTDPQEARIAQYLMRFGGWRIHSETIVEGRCFRGLVFTCTPDELPAGQSFAIFGALSSMVSIAFAEHTVSDGKLIALDAPVDPEVFTLRIPGDYESAALPLWRLQVQPNLEFVDQPMDE